MEDNATVALGDIARIAKVGRPAVSNWRRRFNDFPSPIGGPASAPLFALADVESWLLSQGKITEISREERAWQRLRAEADDLRIATAVGHIGAFLLARQQAPECWISVPDEVSSNDFYVSALPDATPMTFSGATLSVISALADYRGAAETFDDLYERYLATRRPGVLSPELATLMITLASPAGGTLLDPFCGPGVLLWTAVGAATRLLGQERDEAEARLTAARLLLHGHDAVIHAGDSLRQNGFEDVEADAVVCSPPFGERIWDYDELADDPRWKYGLPPRGEPELTWVQHCLHHLKPGGRAVLLMPAAAADRRSGRRIRGQLLRAGTLRAVVNLPSSAAPHTQGSPHLWILHKPAPNEQQSSYVHLMDHAESAWSDIRADVLARLQEPEAGIPLIELLDEEADLTPACHIDDSVRVEDFRATLNAFADSLSHLQTFVNDLGGWRPVQPSFPRTTIAEQARAGSILVTQVPRTSTPPGKLPMLTTEDVLAHRAPTGRMAPSSNMVTARPGDIVVSTQGQTVTARVMETDVALEGGLLLVRPDSRCFDSNCLAGILRSASNRLLKRGQTSASRFDLLRMEMPLLRLDEQQRLGRAFRSLEQLAEAAGQLAVQHAALSELSHTGLSTGRLRP